MESVVANREQKSNRETRKPKKDAGSKRKPAAESTVQSTFAPKSGKKK